MSRAIRYFVLAVLAFAAGTWLLCSPRSPQSAPTTSSAGQPIAGQPIAATAGPRAPRDLPPTSSGPLDQPSDDEAPMPRQPAARTGGAPAATSGGRSARASTRGFRSPDRLAEHFQKHGAEFNAPSAQAYLAMAQALRDAPPGPDILEAVRPGDGVINRFDRKSGAFLAVDPDGTIRTFFRPNDGERYFRRQLNRAPR